MNKKKSSFPWLLMVCIGAILCVGFYFFSASSEEKSELETVHEAKPEKNAVLRAPAPQEKGDATIKNNLQGERLPGIKSEPPDIPPAQQEDPSPSQFNAMLDQAMKQQVQIMYSELFNELVLPETQRKQVEEQLVKSMKAEAEFGMKIYDPGVSTEELLRDQERLMGETKRGLDGILTPTEQDKLTKYQNDLPRKQQDKQVSMFMENLHLEGSERENVRSTLERALQNVDNKKRIGNFTVQDIVEIRNMFGGAKPGDPQFLRATVDDSTKRINSVLKDLEHLPKEQYEEIKKQMEMPLEVMRQAMKNSNQGAP